LAPGTGAHSRKPVVGVTGNAKWWSPSWFCIRLAVWLAGGKARRISVEHHWPIERIDALVVSGGDDIHPSLYGEDEVPKAHYDPARDALEQVHIEWALEHKLPMLGICRGTQLINVCQGGSLYQDIRARRKITSNRGTVLPRKTAALRASSCLATVVQASRLRINSLHHQAIDELGKNINVVARDLDGFVQGIEPKANCHWLGVQWHPEYLWYRPHHLRLFKWLVQQCRQPTDSV
jgi:putative glutamine amidotransferase